MERSLLWSALAMGCLGWLSCVILTRRPSGPGAEAPSWMAPPWLLGAMVPLLGWLATLPQKPPFAPGHAWGNGFLLGGIGALLGAWAVVTAAPRLAAGAGRMALAVAPHFAAVAACALALLFARYSLVDTLLALAVGWLVVTALFWVAAPTVEASVEPASPPAQALLLGGFFAVLVCAAAALGFYRDMANKSVAHGTWSALTLTYATGLPFALLVSTLAASLLRRHGRGPTEGETFPAHQALAGALLTGLLLLWLANLLSVKLINQPALFMVVLIGVVLGPLVWWLSRDGGTARPGAAYTGANEAAPALAVLALLSGLLAAQQLMQSSGAGIIMLTLAPTAGLGLGWSGAEEGGTEQRQTLTHLWAMGIAVAVYRVFVERFKSSLHGSALTDQYDLVGLTAGLALPVLVAGLLMRRASAKRGPGALQLLPAGAAGVGILAAIIVLWGVKMAPALLFGLAIGCIVSLGQHRPDRRDTVAYCALGLAVTVVLLTHRILPAAALTRVQRVHGVAYIAVAALLVVALAALVAQWQSRKSSP